MSSPGVPARRPCCSHRNSVRTPRAGLAGPRPPPHGRRWIVLGPAPASGPHFFPSARSTPRAHPLAQPPAVQASATRPRPLRHSLGPPQRPPTCPVHLPRAASTGPPLRPLQRAALSIFSASATHRSHHVAADPVRPSRPSRARPSRVCAQKAHPTAPRRLAPGEPSGCLGMERPRATTLHGRTHVKCQTRPCLALLCPSDPAQASAAPRCSALVPAWCPMPVGHNAPAPNCQGGARQCWCTYCRTPYSANRRPSHLQATGVTV